MTNLILINLWFLVWVFEAKSDLQTKVAEKFWDSLAYGVALILFAVPMYKSPVQFLHLLVLLGLIHQVGHDAFINIWRGRKPFAHFTVDNDKDWFDKIHKWFYDRKLNLSIILFIIFLITDSAYYFIW